MKRLNCSTVKRRLAGGAPRDGEIGAHLRSCPDCREAAAGLAELDSTLQQLGPVAVPEGFTEQVVRAAQALIDRRPSGSRWVSWRPAWRVPATVLGGLLLGVLVGSALFSAHPARADETLVCRIGGMMCHICAETVENLILQVEGIEAVEVDWRKGTAKIRLSRGQPLRVRQLIEALERGRGYNLEAIELVP